MHADQSVRKILTNKIDRSQSNISDHHHHILSRHSCIHSSAVSVHSSRSMFVVLGPSSQSSKMCSIVCDGWPQGHSLVGFSPHLCRFFPVRPTFALPRFNVTQSFLCRWVPVGNCSVGSGRASLSGDWSHSVQLSILWWCADWGFILSFVMKLFLDLRRGLAGTWSKSGCLGSVSCLNFSNLVVVSLRISGGAIPASLYTDSSWCLFILHGGEMYKQIISNCSALYQLMLTWSYNMCLNQVTIWDQRRKRNFCFAWLQAKTSDNRSVTSYMYY